MGKPGWIWRAARRRTAGSWLLWRRARTVQLTTHDDGRGPRYMWARLDKAGRLVVEGQDLGRGVSEFAGEKFTEYEWGCTVAPHDVGRVVEILGGRPGDDVLKLLQQRSADPAFSLTLLLGDNGIPSDFWSRLGD